ncbi:pyruvyl transferase EpsO [Microbacterium sp. AG157]|uniref:polysaccharide pyruvyl transferase family protein n=1 Tax=Microbacterium sp. AG157 TaxID=2183993 RepID=UPI000E24F8C8|nr:polysaccharide pyruvyl transferase family protein [Microbacterium sp. AG157]REC97323.1 pyruvyl transferase EpsO [Microbacterium sp. AG157]
MSETAFPVFESLDAVRAFTSSVLQGALSDASEVVLLDIPTHENVGDNMIWQGEIEYLKRLRVRVAYEADIFRHSNKLLDRLAPGAPILLHGGGNFGDVWPVFQEFRERVVADHHDRRIVQLPQTVYFQSPSRAAQANAILSAHPNFTLLVRDTDSLERALAALPDVNVRLCPDMALGWTPRETLTRGEPQGILVLAREDKEAAGDLAAEVELHLESSDEVRDWRLTGWQKALWKVTRVPGRLARLAPWLRDNALMFRVVQRANDFNRKQNLLAGLTLVRGRRAVITNRLHAHVLAGLLSVPHVVTENNYGKIGPIFENYTHVLRSGIFAPKATDVLSSDVLKRAENR